MPLKNPVLRAVVLTAMLIMPGGCAMPSQGSFCRIYEPVLTVPKDTETTKIQVDGNNAAFLALCQQAQEFIRRRSSTEDAIRQP